MTISKTRKKGSALIGFRSWISGHKLLATVIVVSFVVVSFFVAYNVTSYLHKFSKSDYDQLTSMAEAVLKESGGKDIQVSRTCSYERPTEFSNLHLYCRVAMVTYLKYESDEMAKALATTFELAITRSFSRQIFGLSSFYERPRNGYGVSVVTLPAPLEKKQCNFYIQSNRNAKRVLSFPVQDDDNLIALSFECSAESRAEYFPVTYRQG